MLVDSLTGSPEHLASCDTSQVDKLLSLIESIMNSDYRTVIELSQQGLTCSQEISYWRGVSMCNYFTAWGYLRQNNYAAATVPAQQALKVAEEHNLPIEEAFACSALGAVFDYAGDSAGAVTYFLQQLKIAQDHHHPLLAAYALGDLGPAYLATGEIDKGMSFIEKSLKELDRLGSPQDKYFPLVALASFRFKQGELTLAYELYKEVLQLGETFHVAEATILALNGMARTCAKLGEFEKAIELLDQSLVVARASDSSLVSEILVISGNIQQYRHDMIAVEKFTQALDIASQTNNWQVTLDAHAGLADVYEKKGDYQKALQHYRAFQSAREKSLDERSRSRVQILSALYETETVHKQSQFHLLRLEAAERALDEYKQQEAERLEMERLRISLGQEREVAALKERILTRISHEFRTPLAIIRTSTELVTRYSDRMSPEKRQEYYDRISEQFSAIEKQLNDISAVLHAKSSGFAGTRQLVNLAALAESAVQQARTQTRKDNHVTLDLHRANREIWIEQPLLQAVLVQLVSNALKFSRDTVSLKLTLIHDRLVIVIEDKGIGIPTSEQSRVFEPLMRGSNIDEVRGSGLGLTIVRDYVELLQGHIELNSEVNLGTRVVISIPLSDTPDQPE